MSVNILVVDDKEYVVQLLSKRLKANGFEVMTARNGKEALDIVNESPPNLIIMDILMPEMDGSTAAEELRTNPKTARIPIIFLTELVQKSEEKASGHVIGGNYFIAKPFKTEDLIQFVREILKKEAGEYT